MRITDLMMSNDFLYNLTSTKSKVADLQTQISTGSKIQNPSDSPNGTSNIIGWNSQISQANTIMSNIDSALSFVNDTTQAMQNIQDEITNVLSKLTQTQNATNTDNLGSYADQIDSALSLILDSANSQSGDKYVFAGTDFTSEPYGYSSSNTVEVKDRNISGAQTIRISPYITQQINLSGTDVFGTIVTGNGNLDSTSAIGSASSGQTTIYDAKGNQYTLVTNYTKSAANTYNFTYDILDSSNASVLSSTPAAQTMVFDSSNGTLKTVDGKSPSLIHINVPSKNIDFNFDPSSLTESGSPASLTFSANQKTDIFNTLITIRDNLRNGIKPTADQIQQVNNFNSRILDNLSKAGNITNRLSNSKDLLTNSNTQLQELISNTQGVDVAKAIVDLQNQDYLLQMSYKLASTVLTKSILDYL